MESTEVRYHVKTPNFNRIVNRKSKISQLLSAISLQFHFSFLLSKHHKKRVIGHFSRRNTANFGMHFISDTINMHWKWSATAFICTQIIEHRRDSNRWLNKQIYIMVNQSCLAGVVTRNFIFILLWYRQNTRLYIRSSGISFFILAFLSIEIALDSIK